MISLLVTVLVIGFAGSFHCTSMCGGLVAFATAGLAPSFRTRLGAIASYNATRGFGYVVLGGAAGAFGSALDGMFLRVGVGRIAGVLAGAVMLAWGVLKALEALGRLRRSPGSTSIHIPLKNLIRGVREKPPAVRASIVGACTAALPCGFLHAALIAAGGTGSAVRGALVATAFWLGTVPAVAGLAFGVDLLTHGLKRRASLLGAAALVVFGFRAFSGVGLRLLCSRCSYPGWSTRHMFADTAEALFAPSATAQVPCTHCGQPVVTEAGAPPAAFFCCAGCASVYSILNDAGLSDFYQKRGDSGASPAGRAIGTSRTYADFDQPEFVKLYCRALPLGRLGTELFLENVHCAACVWLVEKITSVLPGVTEARLDVSRGVLRVAWDPVVIGLSRIASWLDSIGYPCHPLHGIDREAVRRREDRALLMRLGVAGAAAGNAMLLAVAMYCGAFSGIDADYVELFRWGSVLVAVPSVLWCAGVFYRGALSALRTRTPHMDLPVSVGIVIGSADGVVNTLREHGEIYFDTITMLVFLLLVGRYLQQRAQRRAGRTSEQLSSLGPSTARLLDGTTVREVPSETVPIGAVVEVRTGEHVPVDGVVLQGASSIDSSFLTGESMPSSVGEGELVHAGTINLSSRLVVLREKTGHETRLARLAERVVEAAERRAPIVLAANRLSGYFVTMILVAAAITVAVTWHSSPTAAIQRAVALLVVTCPCALALATPLTVSAALGKAARSGLMIKGGESLEALARPGLVVFDKTGTLTRGKLTVLDFAGDEDARALIASAEAGSAHPIAVALSAAYASPSLVPAESMRETLGGGVEAVVGGRTVVVGSARFVRAHSVHEESWVEERVSAFAERALTPVLAAAGGRVLAVVGVGDPIREEAKSSLEALRRLGHRLAVLSGDQPAVVRAVVARIGVPMDEVVGGASPEQKLAFVEERAKHGPVFMVGDGVNDAAALSAATVGIAVHGGAEASLAAADIFATTNGLAPLVELFEGAGRTLRVIHGNLKRSLVYNLTVGGLAATGFVGPLLAAVLMPVSSIGVITSSYRSRTFGSKK